MSKSLYNEQLQQHLNTIEKALPHYLPQVNKDTALQAIVIEAMHYACEGGGKRIRPVLLMEFCRLCGGDGVKALPFACAMEMVHSYSLVHDDLPCMDNSDLRRGKPSTHKAFGETYALLAGDALLNRAFEVMLDPVNRKGLHGDAVLSAAYALGQASGAYGMVGGQVIDLLSEGKAIDLSTLHRLQLGKTAALLKASCEMGAYLGGADESALQAARTFGEQIGLCFQIVDDILDTTATEQQLGKPIGSDADNSKATYVSLLGLDEAKALAQRRTTQALEALDVFGEDADGLRHLAKQLLVRDH